MSTSKRPLLAETERMLDPCTLGRPFHLLEDFNQRLGKQIERHLHSRFNVRHGATFAVTRVAITSFVASQGEGTWRGYRAPAGKLAIRLDRRLILAMLGYHYGDKSNMVRVDDTITETDSEQRFGIATGLSLLDLLVTSIAPSEPSQTFTPEALHSPTSSKRVIRVTVEERALKLSGHLEFALDAAWVSLLFASVATGRAIAMPGTNARAPLETRLPITLSARMLTKEVLLDDVLALVPGDIIPVRLPETADVLIGESRLYRAVIAEHGGTLCLTSFEDIE
ncbi:MAG: FliM/FliN family flagellar motor C-terminal domain-containing protein [Rhodanobacter sp.]